MLISICKLHNQPRCHVEEWERAGNILLLKQFAIGRLITVDLEVDKVNSRLHFVDLDVHTHRDNLKFVGFLAVAEARGNGVFLEL